mmetsp:Transcript_16270/g.18828  ORF Transcript_16270/g.18828 Transcript_16270/m.18828 type:complete len:136 (+) Transcript_16270:103-510(+)
MSMTGVVKSFNPNKGWGFIEVGGGHPDVFLYKNDMKGMCVEKGQTVQFNTVQNEKGHQAQDVNVVVPPDQASYFGEIKSFNPMKGRLDQDGHQIIFLCLFFLFNLQLIWFVPLSSSRCLGSLELQFLFGQICRSG